MKETIKRVLALVMALTITLGLIGCGGPATTIPTGDGIDNNSQKPTAGDIGDVGELGEVSYPLQTDHTLSIWCPSTTVPLYKGYESYKQSPWHTGLAEKTGVEVEWKYPAAGANNQQVYHLLMMNEELPDIISYNIDPGEAQLLYNEDVLVDLKEYLPKYAPDYWAYITASGREEYLRSVTTEEGQIFMFRLFLEDEEVAYGPIVRKDWLDECNLDIPKTIEDWEVMLKTFQQKYGAKFAFPFSRFTASGLASGFGAYTSMEGQYYLDNGEIKHSSTQPEYKEYLGTLARWVDEGLIDVDSLTMSDEGLRTKAINNNCGAAFVVMSLYTKVLSDARAEMSPAEWVAVPYPVVEEGQPTNWVNINKQVYNNGCFITTSCSEEKLITALKWLNYAYSEEGIMYYNYGVENDTYTVDENGVVAFTDKVMKDKDTVATACLKYTGMGNVGACGIHLTHFTEIKNDPIVAEGAKVWIENTEAGDHKIPTLVMTADEASQFANLSTAINTYCTEMAMKVFAGEADISQWDNVIDQMYNLGLQKVLDIQNAAYQRYLNQN